VNGKVTKNDNKFSAKFNTTNLIGKIAGTKAVFMVDIWAEYKGKMVVFQGSTTVKVEE